jgi:transposase
MLAAILQREEDPERLADLARGTARRKRAALVEALRGHVTPHHRTLLRLHLDLISALQAALHDVDAAVRKALEPISKAVERLQTMPGIGEIAAHVIVAEIGVDMSCFPTAGHRVSWAGLCPRNDESAGKRRSTRVRKSGAWLETTLVTAAGAAVRTKDSYLRSQLLQLKSRRGPKKAIVAVAASMITAADYILRDRVPYHDLGPRHFDRLHKASASTRLVRRLQDLGCEVQLKHVA